MGRRSNRGFTVLEILIVVAIMVLMLVLSITSFVNLSVRESLTKQSADIVAVAERARVLTLGSKNASQYGIHFEATLVALFKGTTYSASDPDTVIIPLNSRVSISDISLVGGGQNLVFERFTGKTQQYGTVTITTTSDSSLSETVTINQTGLVETSL